jgi:hypothetical protein
MALGDITVLEEQADGSFKETKLDISVNYDTTVPDSTQNVQVGGAIPTAASNWKNKTLIEALDTILFPTVNAQKTADKSASLTLSNLPSVAAGSVANTYEVGTIINNLTLTANFNPGTITSGSGQTVPLVGTASSFEFLGGDPLIGTSDTYTNNTIQIDHIVCKTENDNNPVPTQYQNKWTVKVNHLYSTSPYFDNKGIQQQISSIESIRGAGYITANSSPVLTGVYPWYYLRSPIPFSFSDFVTAIQTGDASHIHEEATLTKKVSSSSGTISIPYSLNNEYLGVAYDRDTTIKQTYWTSVIDSGPISSLFSSPSAPMLPISVPASTLFDGWTHQYVLLITSSATTNPNNTIELRNS